MSAEKAGDDASKAELTPAPLGETGEIALDALENALRTHYQQLVEEPLPARLLVLLAELEAKEAKAPDV